MVINNLPILGGSGGTDLTLVNVTLLPRNWSGAFAPFTNTVTVTGVTADSSLIITMPDATNITDIQVDAIADANINRITQTENSITFYADRKKPSISIPLLVYIGGISNEIRTVQTVNGVGEIDGNITLTQDNISDGSTYFRQSYKTQKGTATSSVSGILTVTFETAFSNAPIVVATPNINNSTYLYGITIYNITATGFSVYTKKISTGLENVALPFNWIAVGV